MKIAFIGQKGIPAANGGLEKNVERLATRLAEMGHEVFAYVRNNYTDKNLKEYKGVKLIHIPGIHTKSLGTISYTFLATLHSLFRRFDIIHYQSIGPSSLSFIPKALKRKTTVISTFYCRDYLYEKWGSIGKKYLRFGEWITCNIPDKTIAISKTLRSYIFNKYQTKTIYIPNGASAEYNQGTDTLDRWGLKEYKYILAFLKPSGNKGIQKLIESFKNLEDTNKLTNGFKLVIIGDGYGEGKRFFEYLKISNEDRERIIFTRKQTKASLEQLFSHAFLFVQPAETENFSMSLLEAMGCGAAPLVSDAPENLEIIGKCGFSFNPKIQKDLEEKLAYLISKTDEVRRIGKAARERVQKDYSWDGVARKVLKIYETSQKTSANGTFLKKLETENKFYV